MNNDQAWGSHKFYPPIFAKQSRAHTPRGTSYSVFDVGVASLTLFWRNHRKWNLQITNMTLHDDPPDPEMIIRYLLNPSSTKLIRRSLLNTTSQRRYPRIIYLPHCGRTALNIDFCFAEDYLHAHGKYPPHSFLPFYFVIWWKLIIVSIEQRPDSYFVFVFVYVTCAAFSPLESNQKLLNIPRRR